MLPDDACQIPERLRLEGEDLPLATHPLATLASLPAFQVPHAALRRGYVGSWAIVDGRLEMLALYGRLADGRPATLAALFPDRAAPVVADWFSGTLRVARGTVRGWRDGRLVALRRESAIDVASGRVVGRRDDANAADREAGHARRRRARDATALDSGAPRC